MTSNATYSRTITVDAPDFASKAVSFSLLTSVAIDAANNEVFPRKEYSLTLDGSGTGSIALPCPDNSGSASWAWRVSLPDGRDVTTTLAYAGTSLDLSDWLTAATTSETADAITALIESKADKVSGATADNLAGLDANGNLQDSGYGVIDEDGMASDSATDVPTQQSVKAYVDAQIGTVDDVSELTTTGLTAANMLRVAAAGGLEERTPAQVLSDIGAETSGAAAAVQGNLDSHTGNTSNPHAVTAVQVGAAAASHTHGAGDIASGTLAHERGGLEADVSAYSGLVKISGGSTSAVTVTAFGESLIDDSDASTARTTLGLGTMATEATTSYLAATGATTGATSQAQTFTNGIIGPTWKPASDSTTALQLQNSSGTAVVTVDTTNNNLSIVNHLGVDTTASNDIGVAIDSTVSVPAGALVAGLSGSMLLNGVGSGLDTFAGMSFAPRTLVSTNNLTHLIGVNTKVRADHTGGTVANVYGFRMEEPSHASAGTVTTAYGLKLGNVSIGATNYAIYTDAGHVRFGDRLTVIQDSATAAVPVLTLQQDDDSEDMIEFTGTVGIGNAIEAVGAKTLTVTHYVKCTITGVGERYIALGTIA